MTQNYIETDEGVDQVIDEEINNALKQINIENQI